VADELRREPADVVATDFELFGAMAAAEAAGVPSGVLVHNVPWRPTRGVPPRGPGFLPAQGPGGRLRDEIGNTIIRRCWSLEALPALNRARAGLGLPPLRSPFDQFDLASRVLIMTGAAFDFTPRRLAPNVRYVGTPFDDAAVSPTVWSPPHRDDNSEPLVLVSLSTLNQGQTDLMRRVLLAVQSLPARVVVTLGPSLDASQFSAPPNVTLDSFVPHAAILPHISAMVTQCGLGTLTKALAHGVPLVCMPLLGDQPDNAARVTARGAGLRLGADASPDQIRTAIERTLTEPSFRAAARRLGATIAADDGARTAADELEGLAGVRRA
jgi:UDP:flavonoid glycosyltransferase YjiC (YdhE family)